MYGVMLFHLTQLLSACLAAPHARLLRVLLSMHKLKRAGAVSQEELQFGLELLRVGAPQHRCGNRVRGCGYGYGFA
jgi:hypothetical protein